MQLSWFRPGLQRIVHALGSWQLVAVRYPLHEDSPELVPAYFVLAGLGGRRRMPRPELHPPPQCLRGLRPRLDHIVVAKFLLCRPVVCSAPGRSAPSHCWLPPPPAALALLNIAAVQ